MWYFSYSAFWLTGQWGGGAICSSCMLYEGLYKRVCSSQYYSHFHPTNSTSFQKPTKKKVHFGQESCPAGEYLHSERLWMLEKASAALNTTPSTIPRISTKKKVSSAKSLVQMMYAIKQCFPTGCIVHPRVYQTF